MNTTQPPEDERDDQHWIDLIAGRDAPDAEPGTRKEAEALRTILVQQQATQSEDELATERGVKKLLQRLEQEQLLNTPKPQTINKPIHRTIAVAASIVLVTVTLTWLIPPTDPLQLEISPGFQAPPVTRNAIETQTIDTETPIETARTLTKQLKALNIPYRLTPVNDDGWQLDFYIPLDASKETLTFLESWRLQETERGWIRVMPGRSE